jgi:peptidoglycan hydrolase-like protein with peptidoglycan-binding domain
MSVSPRRLLVAVACLGTVLAIATGSTATALADQPAAGLGPPVRLPAHPHGLPLPTDLPKEVDPAAGYQPQQACLAKPMPGVVKLRALALQTYGLGGPSPDAARACTDGGTSEHKDGRAWDWMLSHANTKQRQAAADFIAWLIGTGPSGERGEMAARLGVMYVIYNRKIWASYSPQWRDYTGADPHTTHIHISLSWNGARAHTSFWTDRIWPVDYGTCQVFSGQPATVPTKTPRTAPCPYATTAPRVSTQSLVWTGSRGAQVTQAQNLLGVSPTGTYDGATRQAVIAYQGSHDLPKTGCVDDPTWASLLPASAHLTVPDWTPRDAVVWASKNDWPTLHRGDAGKTVYALQTALRLDPSVRNGFYGQQTRAAVIALKQAAGLPATALVNADVWGLLPVPPA